MLMRLYLILKLIRKGLMPTIFCILLGVVLIFFVIWIYYLYDTSTSIPLSNYTYERHPSYAAIMSSSRASRPPMRGQTEN